MPCYDSRDDHYPAYDPVLERELAEVRSDLNLVTRLLCAVMRVLEQDKDIPMHKVTDWMYADDARMLNAWWLEHQEKDRRHAARANRPRRDSRGRLLKARKC